jgi:hypothetical protein
MMTSPLSPMLSPFTQTKTESFTSSLELKVEEEPALKRHKLNKKDKSNQKIKKKHKTGLHNSPSKYTPFLIVKSNMLPRKGDSDQLLKDAIQLKHLADKKKHINIVEAIEFYLQSGIKFLECCHLLEVS